MNVLLIEDDSDIRSLLEGHFARKPDITLDVVEKGSVGLGQSVVADYDIVLLDLHLPDIGGLDVLPLLRGSLPRAIIAVISGYTDLATEDDLVVADTVIQKPFDLDVIDSLILYTQEITDRRTRIRGLGIS